MSFFFVISKIFITFFLPPGLFITLLFFGYLFIKNIRKFSVVVAFTLWIASTPFFASLLLYPLESPYRVHKPLVNTNYVVTLGGGVSEESLDYKLSPGALKRALLGLELAKNNNLPLIYSGGGTKDISEAHGFIEDMRRIYSPFDIEIPIKNSLETTGFYLFVESKSLNTYQNAKLLKEVFEKEGVQKPKIALVSSAYHLNRSKEIFESLGFIVHPFGSDFKSDGVAVGFRDFFPSMGGLNNTYIAIKEYFGSLSLYLR